MEDQKHPVIQYFEKIFFRYLHIDSLNRQINQIMDWHMPGRMEAITIGSHFFELALYSFGRIVLIDLLKLVNEKEDRSLFHWLEKAKREAPNLEISRYNSDSGLRNPIPVAEYHELINAQLAQLRGYTEIVEGIRVRRNKMIAHADKKFFDDPERLFQRYPMAGLDIQPLMVTIKSILHEQYLLLLHADSGMEVHATSDVERILGFTRAFHRVYHDRRITRDCRIKVYQYLRDDYNEVQT